MVSRRTPHPPICLHLGGVVHLAAPPSLQAWSVPTSSNGHVVTCTGTNQLDGSFTADCRAVGRGTASVSTHTAPFPSDPSGPPQYEWTLVVSVV